jgi:hypothetical protein
MFIVAHGRAAWKEGWNVVGCCGMKVTTPACGSCSQSAGLLSLLADKGCEVDGLVC